MGGGIGEEICHHFLLLKHFFFLEVNSLRMCVQGLGHLDFE